MSAQDTTNEALAKILAELSDLKLRNAQLESKVSGPRERAGGGAAPVLCADCTTPRLRAG